jgi:hypothetical protein
MNLWQATARIPFLVLVVVISSTIQALPGQLAWMCSGASLALRSQRVSRPWRFSKAVAVKGIRRFPSNWWPICR